MEGGGGKRVSSLPHCSFTRLYRTKQLTKTIKTSTLFLTLQTSHWEGVQESRLWYIYSPRGRYSSILFFFHTIFRFCFLPSMIISPLFDQFLTLFSSPIIFLLCFHFIVPSLTFRLLKIKGKFYNESDVKLKNFCIFLIEEETFFFTYDF